MQYEHIGESHAPNVSIESYDESALGKWLLEKCESHGESPSLNLPVEAS